MVLYIGNTNLKNYLTNEIIIKNYNKNYRNLYKYLYIII